VEIGKNNRIEQTPIHNLNLPANPHGYWLFGSLDFQSGNMISSQARYDHFDTAPYMLNRRFSSLFFDEKRLWKELTERTANYSVFRTG